MKVSIIGPGKVGASIGLVLVARHVVDDLLLVGRRAARAAGEAADLLDASSFGRPIRVRAGGIMESADSDVIIISLATAPAEPLAGRDGGATAIAHQLRQLVPVLARQSPQAIFLVASNPVDVLTTLVLRLSGFPVERVMGTGTSLDTMRLRVRLSQECGIHPNDLRVYVIGEHGDSQFVAATGATVGSGALMISPQRLRELEHETREAGDSIVSQKGYTNHGIAVAAAEIIAAIATDSRIVLPVSTLIADSTDRPGVCLSLPVVIGRGGIHQRLKITLSPAETSAFRRCTETVAAAVRVLCMSALGDTIATD